MEMIKMIKKILLGVVILGLIAFAIIGYGTYKVADEALKEREPQLRQYLQLDAAAQDKYVLERIDDILSTADLDKDGKTEDKETIERLKELNTQPEIQNALIQFGRSVIATGIMLSEPIVNDMTPEVKEKYQKEVDELETRLDKYSKLIEAADPRFKTDK